MSWMSKNYHLASLGAGILVLGGLGYLGYSSAQEDQQLLSFGKGKEKEDTSVPRLEEIKSAQKSVTTFQPAVQPKAGERPINLLTSVNLFVRKGTLNEAFDLLNEDPVHPGYDNELWVKYQVDPGYANSPERDPDQDGYSNAEEFDYGTDPSDPKSYPALVHKLEVRKIDTHQWYVMLNSALGNDRFQLKYEGIDADGKRSEVRMRGEETVKVGGIFFGKEPVKNRFKLVEMTEREIKKRSMVVKEKMAVIEDLKPNKEKVRFNAYFRPKGDDLISSFRFDDTVTFAVNAAGLQDQDYRVEPNRSFDVKVDGQKSSFKLLEVKRDEDRKPVSVSVEYKKADGTNAVRQIEVK